MTERSNNLRVGIFVAIGLLAIALMVVYFGRFGESVRGYYRIRVEYPNASGIYKGASVLLAGAKIGSVENNPVILPEMDGVYVTLSPSASPPAFPSPTRDGSRWGTISTGISLGTCRPAPPIWMSFPWL